MAIEGWMLWSASCALADATSLTLTQAIELGRRRAPEIRAARAMAHLKEAQVAAARSAYYPALTAQVSGQGTLTEGAEPLPPPSRGVFSYSNRAGSGQGALNLQWLLYDFGHTPNAVATQMSQHTGALATIEAAERTIVSNVARAYLTLVYTEKLRDVAQFTVFQRERFATIAMGLVRSGLQPPLEELRSLARVEASRVDLANAEAAVGGARIVLAAPVGLDVTALVRVSSPRLPDVNANPQAAARDSALLPSIAAADAMVDSNRAATAAARARYLPTASLQASGLYGLTRYDTSETPYKTASGTASIVVSVPVFEASLPTAVAEARANTENAQSAADQARRDAREEAARAAAAEAATRTLLEHAQKAAEGSARVLMIVQARYVQGLSSPLELIDAENADAGARLAQMQAEHAHALAVVRLLVATGRKIEEKS